MNPSQFLSHLLLFTICVGSTFTLAQERPQAPRLNRVIELLENKKPAFGVFSFIIDPRNGAAMASSGLDFVLIDMEHGPYDPTKLEGFLLGMISKSEIAKKGNLQPSVTPFVRVPAAGREQLQFVIKQVLDLGPMGILVPHVDTAEDAKAMVQACRYPQMNGVADYEPQGKRGIGYGWAARYWGISGSEYGERADVWPLDPKGEIALWLMIETHEAIKNIDAIAQTPGIAGLFIGPSDLAFSLGVGFDDPAVEIAIQKVVKAGKKFGVPVGTLCGGKDVERRLQEGFQFLAVGGDSGPSGSVREAVQTGRKFKAQP